MIVLPEPPSPFFSLKTARDCHTFYIPGGPKSAGPGPFKLVSFHLKFAGKSGNSLLSLLVAPENVNIL